MSTKTKLGPRPAPDQIKFTEDCFETVGEETVYSVGRSALHSGPAYFGRDKDAAEAYAKKTNRPVVEERRAIRARVKWF